MRKLKRGIALSLAAMLTMTAISACGGAPKETTKTTESQAAAGTQESSTTQAAEDKAPVKLMTVSMFGGTDPNAVVYQKINEEFTSTYSYITIEDDSQTTSQEWKTKIAADFAIGNEPDVLQYFTDANANDVLLADQFVTIEEIRSVYPDYAKDILPDALQGAANQDGIQRAVPTTGIWEGMFCNKDLFDQYNLELPTDWDKLLKAIEVFKENGITPIAVSLNEVPHYWVEFLLMTSAGKDEYLSIPETAPESWSKGLEMFKTLRDMGAFPVDTDTIDNAMAENMFNEKKAAMCLNGSWFINGITDQDNTIVCRFPIIPGGKAEDGIMVGGITAGFYITRKAWDDPDKRDAAVKFVMAHTSKESVQQYWNGNGQAATEVTAIADMTPLALSGMEYSNSATNICAPTDARLRPEAYSTLIAGIVSMSTGEITPEELINQALSVNNK